MPPSPKTWAVAALLAGVSAPALAQDAAAPEIGDADARLAALEAQIEALRAQVAEMKSAAAKATPSWKGAPQFADKEAGWSFKLRGRFNYDVGYLDNPGDAIATKNLGFNSRVRRARLGVEGTMPGDFAYKLEADFADNSVSWADAFVEYKPKGGFSVRVGHFETFESLEQMTSTRHIMFLERAQMNEAFNHGRRLGAAIGYEKGDVLFRAGLFNDTINGTFDNDEWLFGSRIVYAPKMGANQLHFGANYQHREFTSTAQNFRYRMRNPNRLSDVRLVDTNSFAASGDSTFGLEAAGIFGPFHVAAEAQWAKVDAISPSHVFGNGDSAGTSNRLAGNPDFFSYYVEAGYWLTGETRGYKLGEWDRTKVRNGFDKGGAGAVAITARYDHLDLSDSALFSGGIGTSPARGGVQDLFQLGLVWQPIDYIRVTSVYAHGEIEGGPFAAAVKPASTEPVNDRNFSQDSFGMRVAFDF